MLHDILNDHVQINYWMLKKLDANLITSSWVYILKISPFLLFYLYQALNLSTEPTASAVVPCAFAVVPLAKFQHKFTFSS